MYFAYNVIRKVSLKLIKHDIHFNTFNTKRIKTIKDVVCTARRYYSYSHITRLSLASHATFINHAQWVGAIAVQSELSRLVGSFTGQYQSFSPGIELATEVVTQLRCCAVAPLLLHTHWFETRIAPCQTDHRWRSLVRSNDAECWNTHSI